MQSEVTAVVEMTEIDTPIGGKRAIEMKAGAERRATGTKATKTRNIRKDPHTKVSAVVKVELKAIETIEIKATTALMAGKGVVSRT